MKYIWSLLLVSLVLLSSCDGKREYTITGVFELPEYIQAGDTVIERGDLNGVEVYLLDIVTHDVIETAMIENETFEIKGMIHPDSAYFATILCQWGVGMLVVEPGNIEVRMTAEGVLPTGTPMNDDIVDLEAALENMREVFYVKLQEMLTDGEEADRSDMMELYVQEQEAQRAIIDSVYEANSNNLVGVYAATMVLDQVQTQEELEVELERYSDFVRNSSLVRAYRDFLEERNAEGEFPDSYEIDPQLLEMLE